MEFWRGKMKTILATEHDERFQNEERKTYETKTLSKLNMPPQNNIAVLI